MYMLSCNNGGLPFQFLCQFLSNPLREDKSEHFSRFPCIANMFLQAHFAYSFYLQAYAGEQQSCNLLFMYCKIFLPCLLMQTFQADSLAVLYDLNLGENQQQNTAILYQKRNVDWMPPVVEMRGAVLICCSDANNVKCPLDR